MASRVEVRFVDQSDFVNKGNGSLLKGSPDWELDSTISLEMTDLLDDCLLACLLISSELELH